MLLDDVFREMKQIRYLRDEVTDSLRPFAERRAGELDRSSAPRDHWQTPQETLERGSGDCEDCAILAYFRLRQSGLDSGEVQLRYCVTPLGPHMVCGAWFEGQDWVLDILQDRPVARDELDYQWVYELDENGFSYDGELRSNIVQQWERVMVAMGEDEPDIGADLVS